MIYSEKMLKKVERMIDTYAQYKFDTVLELDCLVCERASDDTGYYPLGDLSGFMPIKKGDSWGREWGYAWFKTKLRVSDELEGKELWITNKINMAEALIFLNKKPVGMFDNALEVDGRFRLHKYFPLSDNPKAGEVFEIDIEAYAGHRLLGNMPFENAENAYSCYPKTYSPVFQGLFLIEFDRGIVEFVSNLSILWQIYESLPQNSGYKWELYHLFEEIFKLVAQHPDDYPRDIWYGGIVQANELMQPFIDRKSSEADPPYIGLVGHSHLDTAWLWTVEETKHKAARTFSNALTMMDRYPEYRFIQSSVIYIYWMKKHYPDIYEGIKKRTAEGRWEPNGGSWVECDGNMTSGEMMIRQFLRGQRFLRENLGYESDCFWLPDTFGYSAAIPQIMRGCNLKYFLTTKLSWNDTNSFPYDSFIWRGIDGSEVLTHFNTIHSYPNPKELNQQVNQIKNRKISNMKLASYGYGDGGGGPSFDMIETALKVSDIEGCPKSEHTTVSSFMKKLEATAKNLPVYSGELYLEGHRGTLTQKHEIKRNNRKSEFAFREMEILNSLSDIYYDSGRDNEAVDMLDTLLINQFHDILPGSSIKEVHEQAIEENKRIIQKSLEKSRRFLSLFCSEDDSQAVTVFNSLSWERTGQIVIDWTDQIPKRHKYQSFVDTMGRKKLAIGGLQIPAFSAVTVEMDNNTDQAQDKSLPFSYGDDRVETPFAKVKFDKTGYISSLIDTQSGRELKNKKGNPLNCFYIGEDVPYMWDNWDIDPDYILKSDIVEQLVSREVVSAGELQLRIRSVYKIGLKSTLTQDMVFYSDTPRIDFETVLDWQERHQLLKVGFDLNIRASFVRNEQQFGYIERSTSRNNRLEQAKFEICNHKWTDISEPRFGVALLNDCKYGLSAEGSDIRLTLHKGGCRPENTGDQGLHEFVYSLFPHNSGFIADNVIRPAYELNCSPIAVNGSLKNQFPPAFEVSQSNIIIEAFKHSEDLDGYIIRLYESEGTACKAKVNINLPLKKAVLTNMLEDEIESLKSDNSVLELEFRPFEIKTVKLKS